MKRVGIVTCYIDNYGACLQAYSIQKIINDCGFDSTIIRYDYKVNINENKQSLLMLFKLVVSSALKILFKKYSFVLFYKKYDSTIRHNNFSDFRLNWLSFTKRIATYDDLYELDNSFDLYVCGSDQIWNPTLNFARNLDFDTLAFTNKYKIAYAPSIGINKIPEAYISAMKKNIAAINCISCRESLGTDLINNQLKISNCKTVLDPTLMLAKDYWLQLSNRKRKKRYIFCYFFNWSSLYEKAISFFSKLLGGIEVISVSFSDRDYLFKQTHNISPRIEEFPSFIANAELVLTDSFHGTAFSINMNTNFYVFSRFHDNDPLSMNSRIQCLLSLFNLQNRWIKTEEEMSFIKEILDINFNDVNRILFEQRLLSFHYLRESLTNAK